MQELNLAEVNMISGATMQDVVCAAAGAVIGSAIGMLVGGPIGAIAGGIDGAAHGAIISHMIGE